VEAEVRQVAEELDVGAYLSCFDATGTAFSEPGDLVAKCWDLAGINARYEAFIARHVPDFMRCRDAGGAGDGVDASETGGIAAEEAYVLRFQLVHEYRDFPLIDPYLPRSLLPKNWAGECAAHLFRTYHDLLSSPADRYVASVLAEAPSAPASTTSALPAPVTAESS